MIILFLWILFAWLMVGYPIYFYFLRAPKGQILTNLSLWILSISGFLHYIGKTDFVLMKLGTFLLNLGGAIVFGYYFYRFKPQSQSVLSWLDVIMLNSYLFLSIFMLIDLLNLRIWSLTDDFVGIALAIIGVLVHLIIQLKHQVKR